jgi:hypothetical protein
VEETPIPPQPTATQTWTPQPTVTLVPALEPSPTSTSPLIISPPGTPVSPVPVSAWDFGDAPDPAFPSLLASDGARHAIVQFEWLGEGVDQEQDSRQVDYDLYDDGINIRSLMTCTQAGPEVMVMVRDRNDPQHPHDAEHLLYLNVLVDWDGDGSWAGSVLCPEESVASEWAVQNLAIDVSSWPQGTTSAVIPLQFLVGAQAGQAWARFTLSYGEMVSGDDWDGKGAFTFGETEDHLLTISPSPTATPQTASPTSGAVAAVTPTPIAPAQPPMGIGRWQLLCCFTMGLLLGIVLMAIWAARKRGLLIGGLILIAVLAMGGFLYYAPHFARLALVAQQDSPTVPSTSHEPLRPTLTATGEPTGAESATVPPTPYERLIPTPSGTGGQATEPSASTPEVTVTPTPEPDPVVATPSSMGVRQRFGFSAAISPVDQFAVEQIHAGWYYDWGADPSPARPQGMEFVQMIRVRGTSFSPNGEDLERVIENNPGSLWLIGNEPDVIWQDDTTPADYARVYHKAYNSLKSRDPTCQVAIAGVSQATPLRLQYLDMIVRAYQDLYSEMIPVDVWNVHGYILREERGSWGVDIPPGISAGQGRLYEIEDHDDMEIFREQIAAFRRWMRDKGERDKPLIVSEYGIVMPADYGFLYERVRDFMYASFDYFLTASDASLGYPADDNRLVQRWAWYSLSDRVYPAGNLFDPDTGQITPLGLAYGSYTSSY